MSDLIGYQTCALRERSINHNLWLLRDIVYFANNRDFPCAIVSLDQEKAFDRVDHNFLRKVMKGFSHSNDFMKWVKLLYNGASGKSWLMVSHQIRFPLTVGFGRGAHLRPFCMCSLGKSSLGPLLPQTPLKGF